MIVGVSPCWPRVRFFAQRYVALAVLALLPGSLFAQSANPDLPSLPASPDATPAVSTGDNPALPPYAPSNNEASPLLPTSPPLPPHPSIPVPSLLPDSTPPAASPPPLPVPAQTGPTLSPAATGAPGAQAPGGGASAAVSNSASVRRFQYAFRLSTDVTYDDNLFLTLDNGIADKSVRHAASRSDVFFSIEPSVSLGYGDFLSRATNYLEFDYTLEGLVYTKNTDQNTIQHFINLQGAYHFAQVTLTLSQGVQILHSTDLGSVGSASSELGGAPSNTTGASTGQVNLDASQRTGLNVFNTRVDANYAFSDKSSVDLDGYFSAYDYESLISSDTISADAYFNYVPTGKITLGVGVTGGYTIQGAPAPDEFYEQANLRLSYVATGKLSFAGTVGLELRQTSGISGSEVTPVFDLTASYAPFDSTALSLVASRRVDTSAVLTGENFETSGFTFNVSQRLFQRVSARLALGYTHSTYTNSGRGVNINREDDYYFVQPAVDYSIRDNISAGLFYIHRQNVSSLSGNGFSDNQIGARVSLNF